MGMSPKEAAPRDSSKAHHPYREGYYCPKPWPETRVDVEAVKFGEGAVICGELVCLKTPGLVDFAGIVLRTGQGA